MALIVFVFSKQICLTFTKVPGVLDYLYKMMLITPLVIIPNSVFPTFATILRVLKKSSILAWIYLLSTCPLLVGGSYVL